MILYPAIDLFGGKAVRLLRGEYSQMTIYSEDPPAVACTFRDAGAQWAHIVDLEGARGGGTPNFQVISRIIAESGLQIEIGGGVRDAETVAKYLSAGAARVILGTAALRDPAFLSDMTERYGAQIAVGVDLRDGYVAVNGWTENSAVSCAEFLERLTEAGVRTIIATDISRDGAMRGANRALYAEIARTYSGDVIASGGVSNMEDLLALKALGLHGAIIGKAYYTGAIDLAKAVKAIQC